MTSSGVQVIVRHASSLSQNTAVETDFSKYKFTGEISYVWYNMVPIGRPNIEVFTSEFYLNQDYGKKDRIREFEVSGHSYKRPGVCGKAHDVLWKYITSSRSKFGDDDDNKKKQ